VPRLGQDEPGLAALDPEPVREQPGVVMPPVRRGRVDLGLQRLQLVLMAGRQRAVEQLERYAGLFHDYLFYRAAPGQATARQRASWRRAVEE
jgi:hypothetical protein